MGLMLLSKRGCEGASQFFETVSGENCQILRYFEEREESTDRQMKKRQGQVTSKSGGIRSKPWSATRHRKLLPIFDNIA